MKKVPSSEPRKPVGSLLSVHSAYCLLSLKELDLEAFGSLESGVPVGGIPTFDNLMDWYTKNLPGETKAGPRIVHRDYKLDNIIFQPTENHVIGSLTGNCVPPAVPYVLYFLAFRTQLPTQLQLADLANLTIPWVFDPNLIDSAVTSPMAGSVDKGFKHVEGVPITREELEEDYYKATGWSYPIAGVVFVRSWMVMRVSK